MCRSAQKNYCEGVSLPLVVVLDQLWVSIKNLPDSSMALPTRESHLTGFFQIMTNLVFVLVPKRLASLVVIRLGNSNHQSAKYPSKLLACLSAWEINLLSLPRISKKFP